MTNINAKGVQKKEVLNFLRVIFFQILANIVKYIFFWNTGEREIYI